MLENVLNNFNMGKVKLIILLVEIIIPSFWRKYLNQGKTQIRILYNLPHSKRPLNDAAGKGIGDP